MQDAGAIEADICVCARAHRATWFTMEGINHRALCALGSMPGDPVGDLVFGLFVARVHATIVALL